MSKIDPLTPKDKAEIVSVLTLALSAIAGLGELLVGLKNSVSQIRLAKMEEPNMSKIDPLTPKGKAEIVSELTFALSAIAGLGEILVCNGVPTYEPEDAEESALHKQLATIIKSQSASELKRDGQIVPWGKLVAVTFLERVLEKLKGEPDDDDEEYE